MSKETTFTLADNDCAIIFKQDMSTEMMLPDMGDDEVINFDEHQNMYLALAVVGSMGDEDFRKIISSKLDEMFESMDAVAEEVPTCACGPESTCEHC